MTRFIDQTSLFLTLVGLTSLLVGGIGVANGVRAWLEARAATIATLRCLGASSRLVFAVCLIEVLALSACGIMAGVVVGAALPVLAASLLRDVLPVPPVAGVYPGPLALAALVWPAHRGKLRAVAARPGVAHPRRGSVPRHAAAGARSAIAPPACPQRAACGRPDRAHRGDRRQPSALRWGSVRWRWARLACSGWAAIALTRVARSLSRLPRSASVRLGLGNLHRPGAATPLMLVSVGLGLSTLAAVALIQGNVRQQVLGQMPANAPSFYFVDIQNDQLARFTAIVQGSPGTSDLKQVPTLRARVVAVNGVPAEQVQATPETRWALSGDRGLTYAADPPPDTRIVAGAWWPPDYTGPPLVSFDSGLAKGWAVKVGDTIRVNVLGRDIDLRVASLRQIAWQTLGMNFAMVASPGLLRNAPHTHIATVRVAGPEQAALLRAVTDALPNVTGIRVEDVLTAIAALLSQIAIALAATGSLTLVAGALVLVGAVAAGQRRRTQEAVILKAVGATRGQIRTAWLAEFGLLGLAAGVIAALVGTAASYGVVHYVMKTEWSFLPGTLAVTLAGCLALVLVLGYAGTAQALRAKAAPLLRNE